MNVRRTALVVRAIASATILAISVCATSACDRASAAPEDDLELAARVYVDLASALGQRDADSASGDSALPGGNAASHTPVAYSVIAAHAREAADRLRSIPNATRDSTRDRGVSAARRPAAPADTARTDLAIERRIWLTRQLDAVAARASQLGGAHFAIDDELRMLFGVERVSATGLDLAPARARLERLLPGRGSAAARLEAFDTRVMVPPDALPAVFERSLAECRMRTKLRVALPAGEGVTVEYVNHKRWSAFSTYNGDARSAIAVNTDYPLTVDRILQLACHEGYPGHHVMNTMRDQRRALGRPELAMVPLFSPEAFESEVRAVGATADLFTDDERMRFERDVLFPLAHLPPAEADAHAEVARLLDRLAPAVGDALLRYLGGERDYTETAWALQADAFMQHPQTTIFFANQFRGLALAYAGETVVPVSTDPASPSVMSGFAGGPVIISSNGHHSSAGSQGR